MPGNREVFIRRLEVDLLRNFLDRIKEDVANELEIIEKRNQDGKYPSFDHYESAKDFPFVRIEIALRAIGYELTALIEDYLHKVAEKPWKLTKNHKGPKSAAELCSINPDSLRKLQSVSDLPYRDVIKLIENYYSVVLDQLPGWQELQNIRKAVNAFKHRRGLKHYREINWWAKNLELPQRHQIGVEQAYDSIDKAVAFIKALSDVVQKRGGPDSNVLADSVT